MFRPRWHPRALHTFYELPMHSAAMVDRAVIRFAATGEGHVEWVAPYHRLAAGLFSVILRIDREAGTLWVMQIHRRPRP